MTLGLKFVGTHSEKIKGWAFSTDSKTKKNAKQVVISKDGSKAALFASQKISKIPFKCYFVSKWKQGCWALAYKSCFERSLGLGLEEARE